MVSVVLKISFIIILVFLFEIILDVYIGDMRPLVLPLNPGGPSIIIKFQSKLGISLINNWLQMFILSTYNIDIVLLLLSFLSSVVILWLPNFMSTLSNLFNTKPLESLTILSPNVKSPCFKIFSSIMVNISPL